MVKVAFGLVAVALGVTAFLAFVSWMFEAIFRTMGDIDEIEWDE